MSFHSHRCQEIFLIFAGESNPLNSFYTGETRSIVPTNQATNSQFLGPVELPGDLKLQVKLRTVPASVFLTSFM